MKLAFYVLAAVMIAVALVLLLLPLIRLGRHSSRPRTVFALALGIAFVLPLSAAGLYLLVGTPRALDGIGRQPPPMDVNEALGELRAHLKQAPDDQQGWALLAQTSAAMGQSGDARDAYDHLLKLAPDNTTAMVGWAEADSMVRPDHRIEGRARDLLERAVKLEPDNQRGLWLLGISQFQQQQFAQAAATWHTLQPLLEPGSKVANAVQAQIAVAEQRAGAGPAEASSSAGATHETPAKAAALDVEVRLAPTLRNKLRPGDVLYVFARAAQGPPMPLAVVRLEVDKFPVHVTLTDAMAMSAQRKLSSVAQVTVGARISHSGQAMPQSGDLEGSVAAVAVGRGTPVHVTIDTVRP